MIRLENSNQIHKKAIIKYLNTEPTKLLLTLHCCQGRTQIIQQHFSLFIFLFIFSKVIRLTECCCRHSREPMPLETILDKQMKYVIILYIAFGLVLSLVIGIKYNCQGQEMFPTYYGSPFVFKQTSLASSMEYFYSISGLILNVLIWSLVLFLLDKAIQILIGKIKATKLINVSYKTIIGLLAVFTTMNIAIDVATIGRGFRYGSNYWYWDVDKEIKEWGMTCQGEMIIFESKE